MRRWTLLDHRPVPPRPQRAGATTGVFVSYDATSRRALVRVYGTDLPVRPQAGVYTPGAVVHVTVDVAGRPTACAALADAALVDATLAGAPVVLGP